jgi:hypothetical protein
MSKFEPDSPLVVKGLPDCPLESFGNLPLHGVISFSQDDQKPAVKQAERMNAALVIMPEPKVLQQQRAAGQTGSSHDLGRAPEKPATRHPERSAAE